MCPARTYVCEARTYDCDKCNKLIAVGSVGARCTVCDWDLCSACFKPILQPPPRDTLKDTLPGTKHLSLSDTLPGTKQLSLFECLLVPQPNRTLATAVAPQAPKRLQPRQRLKLFKSVTPLFPLRESHSSNSPSSNDSSVALVSAPALQPTGNEHQTPNVKEPLTDPNDFAPPVTPQSDAGVRQSRNMVAGGAGLNELVQNPSEICMQRSTREGAVTVSGLPIIPTQQVGPLALPREVANNDASNQTDSLFPTLTKWLPAPERLGPGGHRQLAARDASNQTDSFFPTLTKWLPVPGGFGPSGHRAPPFGISREPNVPCYSQPYYVTQEIRKRVHARGEVPFYLQNAQVGWYYTTYVIRFTDNKQVIRQPRDSSSLYYSFCHALMTDKDWTSVTKVGACHDLLYTLYMCPKSSCLLGAWSECDI
jgi:hypothetical protein